MKNKRMALWVNLIGFQLLWLAAVMGGARGFSWLCWLVLAVMLLGQWWAARALVRDLKMLAVGLLACLLLEPVWLQSGVIRYSQWDQVWLAPGWIWALWAGFAVSFSYSLAWLQRRYILAAVFGGVGGGFSVLMGIRLGAAQAPLGDVTLALGYGVIWSLAVPCLAMLAVAINHREQGAEDVC